MRLGPRLALTMAAIAVLPLATSGVWAIWISRENALQANKAALEREAEAQADFVARWTHDQVQAIAGWARLYPTLPTLAPSLQTGFLASVRYANAHAVVVALVDEDGRPVVPPVWEDHDPARVVGRTAGSAPRADELVRRLPVTEALASGFAFGEPWTAAGADLPSIPVAVRATSGDPAWILGVDLSFEVARDLGNRSTPDHAVVLLDGAGRTVVGDGHRLVEPGLLAPLLGNHAIFESGTGILGASAPVEGTDWTVAVLVPLEEVERSAAEIQLTLGWALLASAAIAVSAALFVGGSLSRPIAKLRDSALAVADGNYGLRIGTSSQDEVGELARAFDHMSSHLAESAVEISAQRAEIEAFNQELQHRVDRRTRELRDAQDKLVRSGQLAAVAEVGAGLAHELNNPLASILGLTQILRQRDIDPRSRAMLADLEREATRCREVVSTMLRVAQPDHGAERPAQVDAREVVGEAIHLVHGAFRQRGVLLQWEAPAAPLWISVDPIGASRLIAQVLNALRAGLPDGARLEVTASREFDGERRWVVIAFAADRPVASGEARDDWMAAGLGLWVARKLLDQLGGRLIQPGGAPPEGTEEVDRTELDATEDGDEPWRVVLPGS